MLLMEMDVWLLITIAQLVSVGSSQEKCAGSLSIDNGCLNGNSTQDLTSVLRRCCQRGQNYDTKKRTCLQKNETDEFDSNVFNFLSRNASGFDVIVFGMPNCSESQVLIDFTLTPHSFEDISSEELRAEVLCVDRGTDNEPLVGKLCKDAREICEKTPCVRKCCPPGKHMKGKSCATHDSERGFSPLVYDLSNSTNPRAMENGNVNFGVIHGQCPIGKYLLKTEFYLAPNGTIFVPNKNKFYSQDDHCLEDVDMPARKMDGIFAFICFKKQNVLALQELDTRFVSILVGLILSCCFLLATLVVYTLLPNLQNLQGLTLMCQVASFLLAFLCLVSIQLIFGRKYFNPLLCQILAYTMYFSLLASFTWMNIMSFDIWWTIGGAWKAHTSREKKRLVWYSLYAWGCPMLMTLFAIGVDKFESVSSMSMIVKPDMATDTCWFPRRATKSKSELVYFIIPMTLAILFNIVLFILTVMRLSIVNKHIMRVQTPTKDHSKRKLDSDRKTLIITVKLFVVMGVSWLFEGIAYFTPDSASAWLLIPDLFNALRGVVIFAIFVCKPSIVQALADRLGWKRNSKQGTTRSTRTTKSSNSLTPPSCFSTEVEEQC